MAAPEKRRRRELLHLTINPDIKRAAVEHVGPYGSLSRLIEELLARELRIQTVTSAVVAKAAGSMEADAA